MFKEQKFEIITMLSIQLKGKDSFDFYTCSTVFQKNHYLLPPNSPHLTFLCLTLQLHLTPFPPPLTHCPVAIPISFQFLKQAKHIPSLGLHMNRYVCLQYFPHALLLLSSFRSRLKSHLPRETSLNIRSNFRRSYHIILHHCTLFISLMKTIRTFTFVYLLVYYLSS